LVTATGSFTGARANTAADPFATFKLGNAAMDVVEIHCDSLNLSRPSRGRRMNCLIGCRAMLRQSNDVEGSDAASLHRDDTAIGREKQLVPAYLADSSWTPRSASTCWCVRSLDIASMVALASVTGLLVPK